MGGIPIGYFASLSRGRIFFLKCSSTFQRGRDLRLPITNVLVVDTNTNTHLAFTTLQEDYLSTMAPKDKEPVELTASSTEAEKKKEELKKKEEAEDALSEEDKALKERLDTCVSTITNANNEASVTVAIRQKALDIIVTELRTATSSMTSVPKPLKFLRPHFQVIKTLHTKFEKGDKDDETLEFRARVADVLSVLAMTMGKPGMCIIVLLFVTQVYAYVCGKTAASSKSL